LDMSRVQGSEDDLALHPMFYIIYTSKFLKHAKVQYRSATPEYADVDRKSDASEMRLRPERRSSSILGSETLRKTGQNGIPSALAELFGACDSTCPLLEGKRWLLIVNMMHASLQHQHHGWCAWLSTSAPTDVCRSS